MKKISVLIVDDSALMRQMLTQMLAGEVDIEVVGTAQDPHDAREKIKKLNPDVLTLDIEMPQMDGLTFLEKVMTLRPMPVIMVSTLTQKGAEETLRALELGAFDYLEKPRDISDITQLVAVQQRLKEMVRAAAKAHITPHLKVAKRERPLHFKAKREGLPVVALGASTGGVETLRYILSRMPSIAPPMVIAQHMPAAFTTSFAARLNSISQVTVVEAVNGARLQNGYAFLAPGGKHLTIKKQGVHYVCQLDEEAAVSGHRPSVDKLFSSVAQYAGADAIGVLLTGMGRDGAAGLLAMHEKGAHTIAQDEASCVVYGMPRVAMSLHAVSEQLALHEIPHHILETSKRKNEHV